MEDLQQLIIEDTHTLEDAMQSLNRSAAGIVFIVDSQGVLCGLLTDGDVRRAVLNGADKLVSVTQIMNRKYKYSTIHQSRQEQIAMLNDRIRYVPVLDDDFRPVSIVSWANFWNLPVMQPSLGGNELKYVMDCVTSGWISSKGEYVTRFEEIFKEYLGVKYALSTTSGTTALHLALIALGIGAGDEVIVPDLTFGASANVVIHCGATPVFVDVNYETWTMDVADLEQKITSRTKAIMPVHLYGHPADMLPILKLAEERNLYVVEDAAEAMGATYRGKKVGGIGHIGAFSFFANKIITTGEGGMVTTNDSDFYEKMVLMRSHGMHTSKRYWHEYAGYNYRMTNLQAAIGLAQMEQIEKFLQYRTQIVKRYTDRLAVVPGITLPPEADWATNVYWLYSILVDADTTGIDRDTLMNKLQTYGIETRPFFYALHEQPAYKQLNSKATYPVSVDLAERGLSLPTANDISLEQVDFVCRTIAKVIEEARVQRQIIP